MGHKHEAEKHLTWQFPKGLGFCVWILTTGNKSLTHPFTWQAFYCTKTLYHNSAGVVRMPTFPVQSENLVWQILTNLKARARAGNSRTHWKHWLCNSKTLFGGPICHHCAFRQKSSSAPLLQQKGILWFEWGMILQNQNLKSLFPDLIRPISAYVLMIMMIE